MIKLYLDMKVPRELGAIEVYTDRQIQSLPERLRPREVMEFNLERHLSTESIPECVGFTPRFSLDDAGFKNEASIDLLEEFAKYKTLRGETQKIITWENIPKAQSLAGTDNLLASKRSLIYPIFERLNDSNTEFIVYRSYRKFPAFWDIISFYSIGQFDTSVNFRHNGRDFKNG